MYLSGNGSFYDLGMLMLSYAYDISTPMIVCL